MEKAIVFLLVLFSTASAQVVPFTVVAEGWLVEGQGAAYDMRQHFMGLDGKPVVDGQSVCVFSGKLPEGLAFNFASCTLSGVPKNPGEFKGLVEMTSVQTGESAKLALRARVRARNPQLSQSLVVTPDYPLLVGAVRASAVAQADSIEGPFVALQNSRLDPACPEQLEGVRVLVAGRPAGVCFVTPYRVHFKPPADLRPAGEVILQVESLKGVTPPIKVAAVR